MGPKGADCTVALSEATPLCAGIKPTAIRLEGRCCVVRRQHLSLGLEPRSVTASYRAERGYLNPGFGRSSMGSVKRDRQDVDA